VSHFISRSERSAILFVATALSMFFPACGPTPQPEVVEPTTGVEFVDFGVGDGFVCAMNAERLVYCWGSTLSLPLDVANDGDSRLSEPGRAPTQLQVPLALTSTLAALAVVRSETLAALALRDEWVGGSLAGDGRSGW